MSASKEITVSVRVPEGSNCVGCSFKRKIGLTDDVCALFGFARVSNLQKIDECLSEIESAETSSDDIDNENPNKLKPILNILDNALSDLSNLNKNEHVATEDAQQKDDWSEIDLKPVYHLFKSYKKAGFSTDQALRLIVLLGRS